MKPVALLPLLLLGCTAAVAPSNPAADADRWPELVDPWQDYAGEGASVGDAMVPFALPDQYGAQLDYRQFLGFVTVIAVDVAWSGPCQEAASTRQALQDTLQADHPAWVITVLTEQGVGEPPDPQDASAWAERFQLVDTPVVADVRWSLREPLAALTVPLTLVVAPDGTVIRRHEGLPDEGVLADEVAAAASDQAELLRPLP